MDVRLSVLLGRYSVMWFRGAVFAFFCCRARSYQPSPRGRRRGSLRVESSAPIGAAVSVWLGKTESVSVGAAPAAKFTM